MYSIFNFLCIYIYSLSLFDKTFSFSVVYLVIKFLYRGLEGCTTEDFDIENGASEKTCIQNVFLTRGFGFVKCVYKKVMASKWYWF